MDPSKNPFFQTTSSEIGANIVNPQLGMDIINDQEERRQTQVRFEETDNVKKVEDDFDFSFLYARASDVIGSKQNLQPNKMSSAMETSAPRPKRVTPNDFVSNRKSSRGPDDINTVIDSYKHDPKVEDPRYTTSANDYGLKRPTRATYVTERLSRPQGFSSGFNGIKPKNSSLNTTLSKSTVHKNLDPQFM